MKKQTINTISSILPTLDLVAPGVGTAASVLTTLAGEVFSKAPQLPNQQTVNPFREYRKGGELIKRKDGSYSRRGLWDNIRANKGSGKKPTKQMLEQEKKIKNKTYGGALKEYDVPSHEDGGAFVDSMGNPAKANTAVANIEKQETIYTGAETPYVFSDNLKLPDGKTFAKASQTIERRYKGKKDLLSLNSKKLEFEQLKEKNDAARMLVEAAQQVEEMKYGGYMDGGGPLALLPTRAPGQISSVGFQLPKRNFNQVTSMTAKPPQIRGPQSSVSQTTAITAPTKGGFPFSELLKTGALIASGVDAFQNPEKEVMQQPDFGAGDQLYSNLNVSNEAMLRENQIQATQAMETARGGSGNYGQLMARLNAIQGAAGRNAGLLKLQGAQYNNQINMQRAGREDTKAMAVAQEKIRTQTADSQNLAMSQDLRMNFINNVNNLGTELQKQDYIKQTLAQSSKAEQKKFLLGLAVLNAANPNFQIDAEILKTADNPLDAIKFR